MLLSALIPLAMAGLVTLVEVTWQSQLALINIGYDHPVVVDGQ